MTNNPLFAPGLIRAPFAAEAKPGHELVDLAELNLFQQFVGSETQMGYHTEGDLVTVSADGRDLNGMWAEFQQTLSLFNQNRQTLIDLLTYPVTQLIESVPQVSEAEFEEASEFGEPRSARVGMSYFEMAYDFRDYDVATRYTWKFLRDADARQIEAVHQSILDADRRLVFRKVMEAIFDNSGRSADIRNQNYNVYPLYNGDGTVPPRYQHKDFRGDHSHYMVSESAVIDSDDLIAAQENIAEHGYSYEQGTTFVVLLDKASAREVRRFRAGQTNNNGVVADYDFIPAPNQPTFITPTQEGLEGARPPSEWNGLTVFGSYAGILLVEEGFIPEGYFLMFGSGGAGNLQNPVGLREHANPAYRGLRLLPGNQQNYPLVDSYYSRGFGTGVRQRAGAVVMQITTGTEYQVPAQYRRGGGLT